MAVSRISTQLVLDGTLTHLDVNAANIDGVDATPCMRRIADPAVTGVFPPASGTVAAADDVRINFSPSRFKHGENAGIDPDQDGLNPHYYLPGWEFVQPNFAGFSNIAVNRMWMLPVRCTPNIRFLRIGIPYIAANASNFNWGFYTSRDDSGVTHPGRTLYPDSLIASGGAGVALPNLGPHEISINVSQTGNSVMWFAYMYSTIVGPTHLEVLASSGEPILGWHRPTTTLGSAFNGAAAGIIGYRIDFAFGSLPSVIPDPGLSGAPVMITPSDDVPAVFLGYS